MPAEQRLEIEELGRGVYRLKVNYGFMEDPDIPEALGGALVDGQPLLIQWTPPEQVVVEMGAQIEL